MGNLAKRIVETATLEGEFLLRSGVVSNVYFDKYLLESDPALLKAIAEAMVELVPGEVDALAGLEMGGIPIATMLGQLTGLPVLFVRKEAKKYGTCKLAEGGEVSGKRLLIVEDVVTSGGAILEATTKLRALGARIDEVVCVINREAGGEVNLGEVGLNLRALFTKSALEAEKKEEL